jgi:tetratricopeptide (TPR) repeat protein
MRTANRFPYLTVGWLWFLGTIVPVMGIVQVGGQAMADRYTYIPLIGLFIMSAWGIPELLKKWRYRKEALFASSALILACLFVVTWTQVGYWRNSIILYDHALKVTSRNDTIHNNRGDAFCRLGNLRQAIPDFDKAVGINPENADAYYNRGVTYGKLGDNRRAIEDFDRSIEINPKRVEPYYNRGFAYGELGDQGQAIENFSMAIEIAPENADA